MEMNRQEQEEAINTCPLVEIGDTLTYYRRRPHGKTELEHFSVARFVYDEWTRGCCAAYKKLALALNRNGSMCYNPGNSLEVDCHRCPVIQSRFACKKGGECDPDH